VSAAGQPALVGLGSSRDGQASAVVLDSGEMGRLVRALRDPQTVAQLGAVGAARLHIRPTRSRRGLVGSHS
jgi:hypothetical protein